MNEISPSAPPPAAVASPTAVEQSKWYEHIRSGSSWLWLIALLSIINSAISFFGGDLVFVVGLGISQFVDAVGVLVAEEAANAALIIRIVTFVISLAPALILAGFGFLARKGKTWAFAVPAVAYGLDLLLVLVFQDWLGAIFHLVALFYLVRGARAASNLKNAAARP